MFLASGNGIHLYDWNTGTNNMTVANNLFQGLTGTAMWFDIQGGGVAISNPKVDNNIFVQCSNAVLRTGSSSYYNAEIAYNCLYNCQTDFVGFSPGTYGTICCQNPQGTNCDLAYNIFQNPLFAETVHYTLSSNSPCVDAGNPASAYANMCFPPSIGTTHDDIGVNGGPYACNWLNPVPILPVTLSLTNSTNQIWLNFMSIPRSTYKVQSLATNWNATTGTNNWLTSSTVTPAGPPPVSIAVSPYPPTNTTFYRVQSLGLMPRN
jgi:hypothetical protein